MSRSDLRNLIEIAQPEVLIPIHTLNPKAFEEWHNDVRIQKRYSTMEI